MNMKRRAFFMAFLQAFSSPAFYLSIIGVTALCFISVWRELTVMGSHKSIFYFIDIFIGLTMFKKLVVVFAAIPYVSSFCSDWRYRYVQPIVIRTGVKRYTWSKIITCFVSGFLTVFIGLCLFITLLSFKIPLLPMENMDQAVYPPFAPLASGGVPILFVLAQCFVFSLAAALWSVVGMAVSAFIPIPFVAIASPVIASYLLEQFTSVLPKYLDLYYLTRSANVIHQGPFISFAYFLFIFILYSILTGFLFDYQVRRRLRSEVV